MWQRLLTFGAWPLLPGDSGMWTIKFLLNVTAQFLMFQSCRATMMWANPENIREFPDFALCRLVYPFIVQVGRKLST